MPVPERLATSMPGGGRVREAALARLVQSDFLNKLWRGDPSPWSNDPQHVQIIKGSLGWLTFPATLLAQLADLTAFAAQCAVAFTHVVVLGMGGSSLAPDVFRATFGMVARYPELHVLDSSDPDRIASLEASLDLARSLFVVASKSGTTTEPEAFFRYFYDRVRKTGAADNAGRQFVVISDPGTQLAQEAKQDRFLRIFENDPKVGGRYSALSYFGMVPAALAGYDVAAILARGCAVLEANSRTTPVDRASAVRLGATFAALAKNGHDKLTIVAHPDVSAFGAWAEQLIAESTGKAGKGIVPVEGEPLGVPDEYGADRTFVYVGAGLPSTEHLAGKMDGSAIETRLGLLEKAGFPVIRLGMTDKLDIGEQFALWEIATAAAGAVLGIDAFDQPNVQESKDNTKRLLAEFGSRGSFSEPAAALTTPVANVIPLSGSKELHFGAELSSALAAIFAQVQPGDYVAFTAYLEINADHVARLTEIRLAVRNALKVATTVGFGPRFLHSTGQLHKGGPNTGVFIQLTADPAVDRTIPGMGTFGNLLRAQALGDFESLERRGRRGARLHLTEPLVQAFKALEDAVSDALAARSTLGRRR